MLNLAILQFVASPAFIAYSTTFLFSTGNVPGIAIHIGQQCEFGSPPNSVEHEQNILVFVDNSLCTSNPITIS